MLTQQICSFPISTQKLGCDEIAKCPDADSSLSSWKIRNSLLTPEGKTHFPSQTVCHEVMERFLLSSVRSGLEPNTEVVEKKYSKCRIMQEKP